MKLKSGRSRAEGGHAGTSACTLCVNGMRDSALEQAELVRADWLHLSDNVAAGWEKALHGDLVALLVLPIDDPPVKDALSARQGGEVETPRRKRRLPKPRTPRSLNPF